MAKTLKLPEVKRYKMHSRYDSWYACDWVTRMVQRKTGEWVKWEDYKKLLEKLGG